MDILTLFTVAFFLSIGIWFFTTGNAKRILGIIAGVSAVVVGLFGLFALF